METKEIGRGLAKWGAIGIGALVFLGAVALGVTYAVSSSHFNEHYDIDIAEIEIPDDEETVEWGKHIAHTRGCQDCHGEDFGGDTVMNNFMMGNVQGANLTNGEGGLGEEYTVEDYLRAIRHGVGADGQPLLFMPSHEYNPLGERDVKALIAYLQQLEPVDNVQPDPSPGPMMRILYLQGSVPLLVSAELIDHDKEIPEAPEVAPTREYGEYVANMCKGCHGETFSGGPIPGVPPDFPPATNLTPHESGIKDWSREDFETVLTEGKTPDGKRLDKKYMPWNLTKRMLEEERAALYKYFMSVAPKEEGNR